MTSPLVMLLVWGPHFENLSQCVISSRPLPSREAKWQLPSPTCLEASPGRAVGTELSLELKGPELLSPYPVSP